VPLWSGAQHGSGFALLAPEVSGPGFGLETGQSIFTAPLDFLRQPL
jgi:hypothetical protein